MNLHVGRVWDLHARGWSKPVGQPEVQSWLIIEAVSLGTTSWSRLTQLLG